ncbi:MAG: hypothetical protein Q7S00_07295, partial [bacterium]|nr:hypothetical protein [bacterium]
MSTIDSVYFLASQALLGLPGDGPSWDDLPSEHRNYLNGHNTLGYLQETYPDRFIAIGSVIDASDSGDYDLAVLDGESVEDVLKRIRAGTEVNGAISVLLIPAVSQEATLPPTILFVSGYEIPQQEEVVEGFLPPKPVTPEAPRPDPLTAAEKMLLLEEQSTVRQAFLDFLAEKHPEVDRTQATLSPTDDPLARLMEDGFRLAILYLEFIESHTFHDDHADSLDDILLAEQPVRLLTLYTQMRDAFIDLVLRMESEPNKGWEMLFEQHALDFLSVARRFQRFQLHTSPDHDHKTAWNQLAIYGQTTRDNRQIPGAREMEIYVMRRLSDLMREKPVSFTPLPLEIGTLPTALTSEG